ncbi:MAG: putative Macrolide-specific efflux protein macA precursor [Acidobacteria bacterium]|nr:putative Macrolide-specific efflux protein macA precursor [Acidobacteriota bacterium]
MQRHTWHLLTIILVYAILAFSCSKSTTSKGGNGRGGSAATKPAVQVHTAAVQRISIERQVDISGTLASTDQAKVSSEVAGVVQQVLVELGTEVKPGQVLVKLDPTELQLALQRAESALRQTEAQLGIDAIKIKEPPPDEEIPSIRTALANRDDARAQLARARRLMSQKLLPQADLDTAETRVKVTEANYQAALENVRALKASLQDRRASLELAKKKLNDASIRSSVGGQVSEKFVQPGEYIRENTPVVSVVQMNPLKLKTAVQEKYASTIKQNQPAQFQVESFPDAVFIGRVAYISPAVDQTTRTFQVEILVDNRDRRLKPGFFAKGIIQTKLDENVMAVPEEAISQLAGMSSVFAIADNKARQLTITIGSAKGNLVEVVSGLNGDEVLAVSNINQLANGVAVEVVSGSAAAAQAEKSPSAAPVSEKRGGRQ